MESALHLSLGNTHYPKYSGSNSKRLVSSGLMKFADIETALLLYRVFINMSKIQVH